MFFHWYQKKLWICFQHVEDSIKYITGNDSGKEDQMLQREKKLRAKLMNASKLLF